ncbi:MAG: SRPBCC family protein [Planctomycetota bacterium]
MNRSKRTALFSLTLAAGVLLLTGCASQIDKRFTVDAPPEHAWSVLAEDFADVSVWASEIGHSVGTQQNGTPATRSCETSIGTFKETVVEYDEDSRVLAYRAESDDMPGFVRELTNRWTLTANEEGGTEVQMQLNADLSGLGNLMWPMMYTQLNGPVTRTIEDFKYYVEHGTPHPRKLAATEGATP